MKLKEIPLPDDCPKLPVDYVFLGFEIPTQENYFTGRICIPSENEWRFESKHHSGGGKFYYAAPRDSEIAKKILGHEFEIGDEVKNYKGTVRVVTNVDGNYITIKGFSGWYVSSGYTLHKDVKENKIKMNNDISAQEAIIFEQIRLAKAMIGKEVKNKKGLKFTPECISIVYSESNCISPPMRQEVDDNGFCVYVTGQGLYCPVMEVKIAPEIKTVKLNENHTAEVHEDKIVVGCQTFDIENIRNLVRAYDELNS